MIIGEKEKDTITSKYARCRVFGDNLAVSERERETERGGGGGPEGYIHAVCRIVALTIGVHCQLRGHLASRSFRIEQPP